LRLIWLCAIVVIAGCERRQHLVEQHLLEFGTIIEITMISDDLLLAERLLAEIEQRLKRQRKQWHAWEDSDLTRFNLELQRDSTAEIPASLSHLLQLSRDYQDASGGLFNPALGKLIAAYGFHGGDVDAQAIAEIRLDIPDMRDLQIDGDMASSRNPHLQIDLGGIAKGYAIGGIAEFLDGNGIDNYVINAGGDLVIAGSRFGRPWRIGIQNPFAPGHYRPAQWRVRARAELRDRAGQRSGTRRRRRNGADDRRFTAIPRAIAIAADRKLFDH